MRLRNLAAIATLLPVLLLPSCGTDAGVAAAAPAAHKADDPVVQAYYTYRVALDVMMRSGGMKTEQLEPVMTPRLFQAISAQAKYYRTNKLHNTGLTKVVWAKRTLASDGVLVTACYDTTSARTVNTRGRGVLPNTTPTRWLDQMRVVNQANHWLVDGGTTTPTPC
jgi:hypothetical protein